MIIGHRMGLGLMGLAATLVAYDAWGACSAGRFVVSGKGPFAGETAIALAGDQVSIPGRCPATAARVVIKRRLTKVTAVWAQCSEMAGPVRLTATISAAGCRTLRGRVRAKGAVRRRFRATRYLGDPARCAGDTTLDQIQHRIIGPRGCRVETCHGSARAGGLDLRLGVAHQSLVGVPATTAAGKLRVLAGNAEASFLWQKLTGHLASGEGGRMPPVGRLLDDMELDLVRTWIEDGAPAAGRVRQAPCLPPEQFVAAPALARPPGGHQIVFEGPTLPPGEEIEGCIWVRVPNGEDFVVGRWEYSLNPGTHHFALWDHERGPEPELGVFKRDTACISGGARTDGATVSGAPEAPYFVDAYPVGVGKVVRGGSLLGINPHYHNDFDLPVQVKAWINLHPVAGTFAHRAETLVSTFAQFAGKSSFSIFVPPQTTGTLRLRYANTTDRPWAFFQLSSHEHMRGTRVTAWRSDGTQLFENLDWAHPAIISYDPPLVLQPGDYFEYECEHDNGVSRPQRRCGDSVHDTGCTPGEAVPVRFGVTAVDEMCFLTGLYYSE